MKKFTTKLLVTASAIPALMFASSASACAGDGTQLLGSMCAFAGNFAPRGYSLAHGQLLAISQYTALFSIVGTTYGGDGRSTFGLPDTRGRALIGWGNGPGLSNYQIGARGGAESVTLSEAQLPSHSHAANTMVSGDIDIDGVISLHAFSGKADAKSPAGNTLGEGKYATDAPDVMMNTDSISFSLVAQNNLTASTEVESAGGGQAHENRMPYIAVTWVIAVQGIFPSRN
ncbi:MULTISPECIES: phage tail protein [unclassified Pseudoalteromonas]|uniref:phage tail protein n=1 Tax=unclassified Pseudoalteromonas TaxID=194690 RepID=UPI000CF67589|nr:MULTISPECIES: tail fiber protein [unclassified Pseudoalteromonas]